MRVRNNLLYLDEINNLKMALNESIINGKMPSKDEMVDTIYEMLEMAYAFGNTDANLSLDSDVSIDKTKVDEAIEEKIAGKTTKDRIFEYVDANDINGLVKVAESESHRLYNQGAIDTAVKAGAKTKTWVDMGDDKVRDTHVYINGMTIGINNEFYTYDGDHALMPGGFESAENNVNCRCWLEFGY